ncbi:hypothetical protein DKE47_000645 [Acinetobacter nosocomialis]|nr:hypothetical protein DKE47_000645 [Acinetobacter nosocomialis]
MLKTCHRSKFIELFHQTGMHHAYIFKYRTGLNTLSVSAVLNEKIMFLTRNTDTPLWQHCTLQLLNFLRF